MKSTGKNWLKKFPRGWATPHLLIGGGLIFLILVFSIGSFIATPHDPTKMNIDDRLGPPSKTHWFGTDQYGRDLFSRVVVGSRNSLIVGFIAVGLGILLGVPLGSFSAYLGQEVDSVIMRVMDILYGFPPVITAVLVTSILGPSLTNSIIAIGLFNIPIFARITRGNFLSLKERQFVEAARSSGRSELKIITRHILPNLSSPIVVQAATQFALALLAEAALSYLGLGVQPPHPSWGLMLKQAQTYMSLSPWPAVFPGLFIVLTVLGFTLTGDGLRDLLDPRLSREPRKL